MPALHAFAVSAVVAINIVAAPPVVAEAGQTYPNRAIRIVVPATAGGTPDMLARMIGQKLSEAWKQPLVIENRTGAAGTIGTAIVAKAAPDGYTLLMVSPAFAVSAALQRDLPYDPIKDFSGVTNIGFGTTALVVTPSLGVKSVKELIALAHVKQGAILFGSAGAGSSNHMNGERFRLAAGIKAVHVGFKGQPEFLIEIATGRIHYGVAGLGPALPFIRDEKLLALAVTTPQRSPVLPDVPTAAEVLPGWGRDGSQTLLAPAGTPRPILSRISKEVRRILDLSDIKDRLQAISFHIAPSTPEETDKGIRADIETFKKVAVAAGLRPQ